MEYGLIAGKLVFFVFAFVCGIYGGVFFHELGHALGALIGTKQTVELQVGTGSRPVSFELGRLKVLLGLKGFRYGFTRYDRTRENLGVQVFVAALGPLATLLWGAFCFAWVYFTPIKEWTWIAGTACFIANFRILMVVLWPFEYRPYADRDDVWLSDTLDVWRMLKRRKSADDDD